MILIPQINQNSFDFFLGSIAVEENGMLNSEAKTNRMILNSRSLSLELAKQKHKIAAQLVSKSLNKSHVCTLHL